MKEWYVISDRKTLIGTGVVGFSAGVLTWLVSMGLSKYFVEPIFCRNPNSFTACASGGTIAFDMALILVAIAAVAGLVRVNGYRPLLVAIAAVATLWSANRWLGVLSWWEASLWLGLLMAIAYLMYSWLCRLLSFPLSIAAVVVVVVLARLIVT